MTDCKQVLISEVDRLLLENKLMVLDLRDPLEYRCGHINDAINLARDNVYLMLENMNRSLPILFYGNSEHEACEMAMLFSEFGFSQCWYLEADYETLLEYQSLLGDMPDYLCNWLNSHGFGCEDINQRGFNGETPLMTAARSGQLEYLIELINRGADLELLNNDGNSAVWLACYSNNIYALLALIEAGANINVQNVNGASALIYSASAGRVEMVRVLLQAGAKRDLLTLDGFSALDVASTLEILKLLRRAETENIKGAESHHYLKAG